MTRRATGVLAATVLVATASLASGCGSMSRSEYVAAVQSSCASAAQDQQRILRESEEADRSLADTAPDLSAAQRRFAEDLKDLHPPDDLSAENDALVDQVATSDPSADAAGATRRLERAYRAVGATTCADRVAEQLRRAEQKPGL